MLISTAPKLTLLLQFQVSIEEKTAGLRYEREVAKPTIEVAGRLADVLGVSLDYLIGKVDTALDADTLSRVRAISGLSEDDRSFVLPAMDGLIRDLKTQRAYAATS